MLSSLIPVTISQAGILAYAFVEYSDDHSPMFYRIGSLIPVAYGQVIDSGISSSMQSNSYGAVSLPIRLFHRMPDHRF